MPLSTQIDQSTERLVRPLCAYGWVYARAGVSPAVGRPTLYIRPQCATLAMNCLPSFQLLLVKRICNHLVQQNIFQQTLEFPQLLSEIRKFVFEMRQTFGDNLGAPAREPRIPNRVNFSFMTVHVVTNRNLRSTRQWNFQVLVNATVHTSDLIVVSKFDGFKLLSAVFYFGISHSVAWTNHIINDFLLLHFPQVLHLCQMPRVSGYWIDNLKLLCRNRFAGCSASLQGN